MNLEKIISLNPKRILDIGANIGQFHQAIKTWLPDSFIYSIEANPLCISELIKVTNEYKICLLGNETKHINFYTNISNPISTGASYYKENTEHFCDDNLLTLSLKMVRLDDLNLEPFDFVKIDTQGSELDIIKGGINLIKKAKHLLIEATTKGCYNLGSPCGDDVLEYLWKEGFKELDSLSYEEHNNVIQEDILFKNIRLTL